MSLDFQWSFLWIWLASGINILAALPTLQNQGLSTGLISMKAISDARAIQAIHSVTDEDSNRNDAVNFLGAKEGFMPLQQPHSINLHQHRDKRSPCRGSATTAAPEDGEVVDEVERRRRRRKLAQQRNKKSDDTAKKRSKKSTNKTKKFSQDESNVRRRRRQAEQADKDSAPKFGERIVEQFQKFANSVKQVMQTIRETFSSATGVGGGGSGSGSGGNVQNSEVGSK